MMFVAMSLGVSLLVGTQSLLATTAVVSERFPSQGSQIISRGYELGIPIFYGTAYGEKYAVNGTVEARNHLHCVFVNAHPDKNVTLEDMNINELPINTTALEKRRDEEHMFCIPVPGQPWGKTWSDSSQDAADLLRGGRVGVRSRQCARLACVGPGRGKSAIFLCNDRPETIDPSILHIASYADDIGDRCVTPVITQPRYLTGGQNFDTDWYNVILRDGWSC